MNVQEISAGGGPSLSVPEGTSVVSFVFDRLPVAARHDGVAILEQYGCRGTFFASQPEESGAEDLVQRGHEVRRSDRFGHVWPQGLNRGEFDLATLKAWPLSGSDDVYRAALARIHEAGEGGWLVFHTQDVGERPSLQGARSLVFDYIVRTVIDARLTVMTVGAAVQHLSRR